MYKKNITGAELNSITRYILYVCMFIASNKPQRQYYSINHTKWRKMQWFLEHYHQILKINTPIQTKGCVMRARIVLILIFCVLGVC